jgi:hypothetical protein
MKKILRIAWKILWRTLVAILLLVILIFIALKLPVTQRFIADKAEDFLEGKTNTEVNIGYLNINFPKAVSIEDLFVEDRNKDTLLAAGKIGVSISLSDLMEKRITVTDFELKDIYARVIKKDTTFNFNHFITAFSDTSATKQAPADTSSGPGWAFGVQDVSLQNIRARYYDLDTGDSTDAFLGNFQTSFETFDLENQKFYLEEILLENTNAQVAIHSSASAPKEESDSTTLPEIRFENIQLNSISADYQNYTERQHFTADLSELLLSPKDFNLREQIIELDEIELSNSTFTAEIYSAQDTTNVEKPDSNSNESFPLDIPWKLSLTELDLSQINLEYHNTAVPDTTTGFDANHISLKDLDLGIADFKMADSELVAKLNDLAFESSQEFAIEELKTEILFNDQKIDLENLVVKTSRSSIEGKALLAYPTFSAFISDLKNGNFTVDLESRKVSSEDVTYWVPALADSIFNPKSPSFNFALNAEGTMQKMLLKKLNLGFGNNTQVNVVEATVRDCNGIDRFKLSGKYTERVVVTDVATGNCWTIFEAPTLPE